MGFATGHDKRGYDRDEQVFHNLSALRIWFGRTVAACYVNCNALDAAVAYLPGTVISLAAAVPHHAANSTEPVQPAAAHKLRLC